METFLYSKKLHVGRNLGRLREIFGIKQDYIAAKLGVTQQNISKIEKCEEVDLAILEKFALIFGVTVEAIKSFNEESFINSFLRILNQNAVSIKDNCAFLINPLDKLFAVYEDNQRLYERLLRCEFEKNIILGFDTLKSHD